MYLVPMLVLAFVIVIGAVWTPIFALVIAVPAFAIFLAYVGMSRRADQKMESPTGAVPSSEAPSGEDEEPGGLWGERRA